MAPTSPKRDVVLWGLALGGGATVIGGALFYFAWLFTRWDVLNTWGALGSAVAPFAAVLSACALFAAVWSAKLQREELRMQREESEAQRLEMVEQRKQFERTAEAQIALARAQEEANVVAHQGVVEAARSAVIGVH